MKRLTFREFYAERFKAKGHGHWAGETGELTHVVFERVVDALADYADYVANYMEKK